MTTENPKEQMSSSSSDLQSELPKPEGNSTSPKSSVKKILALGLLFIVVASLLAIFVIMGVTTQRGPADQSAEPTTVVTSPSPSTMPTEAVTPTESSNFPKARVLDRNFNTATDLGPVSDISPFEINGIYLVKHQGKDALYVNMQNINGHFAELRFYENGELSSQSEVNPETLTERVLIFRGRQPQDDLYLTGFTWDQNQEHLYFSMVSHSTTNSDSYPDTSNVFHYSTAEQQTDIVVQTNIWNDTFLEYDGAFTVKEVLSDKYLLLTIGECYACGEADAKSFVLNTENLGYNLVSTSEITDVTYDEAERKISYRTIMISGYGEGEMMPIPTYTTSTEVFSTDLP